MCIICIQSIYFFHKQTLEYSHILYTHTTRHFIPVEVRWRCKMGGDKYTNKNNKLLLNCKNVESHWPDFLHTWLIAITEEASKLFVYFSKWLHMIHVNVELIVVCQAALLIDNLYNSLPVLERVHQLQLANLGKLQNIYSGTDLLREWPFDIYWGLVKKKK